MKNLLHLQNNFARTIYEEKDELILSSIQDGKIAKAELIDIYRNNVFATLINCLRLTFETIYNRLGKEKFKKIAYNYIKAYPSQSGNLEEYGEFFSNFLEDDFLSQLAGLEWLVHLSYFTEDSEGINVATLQTLSSEELFKVKFQLHPSCFLYESDYNLIAVFNDNKRKNKKKSYILISRATKELECLELDEIEFTFLSLLQKGKTLYQIHKEHPIELQTLLPKFIQNRVLDKFLF